MEDTLPTEQEILVIYKLLIREHRVKDNASTHKPPPVQRGTEQLRRASSSTLDPALLSRFAQQSSPAQSPRNSMERPARYSEGVREQAEKSNIAPVVVETNQKAASLSKYEHSSRTAKSGSTRK